MLTIKVLLPEDRSTCGTLEVLNESGSVLLGPCEVAGTAAFRPAERHGNPSRLSVVPFGNTASGDYTLTELVSMRGAADRDLFDFGTSGVAVLEARSGQAALADAAGRLETWIHGGLTSPEGYLRATNGSLRLNDDDQKLLMKLLYGQEGTHVEVRDGGADGRTVADSAMDRDDPPAITRKNLSYLLPPFKRLNAVRGEVYLGEYSAGSSGDVGPGGTSLIAQHENGPNGSPSTTGYTISGPAGAKSGVTISTGYDLGQHTASEIQTMGDAIGLPQATTDSLKQFAGLTGTAASNALQQDGAPTITSDQAVAIQNNQIGVYTNVIANAYNATTANLGNGLTFTQLPSQAQTVLVDLGYAQGTAGIEGTHLWTQMASGQWSAAQANLANYQASGGSAASLNARAASDGQYMGQAPASSYPTPSK